MSQHVIGGSEYIHSIQRLHFPKT